MNKEVIRTRLLDLYGRPARETVKVIAWERDAVGVVFQVDQPNREEAGFIWLPYPQDGQTVPEIALEYAAESGRHSGTYASSGLRKDQPALKLIIRTERELTDTLAYIDAMVSDIPLPAVEAEQVCSSPKSSVDATNGISTSRPDRPRREAIPRAVQREVWQRDMGRCVECESKERLCYDHIIPFSRGGSNTIRNLQLLCEPCNLRKGSRI